MEAPYDEHERDLRHQNLWNLCVSEVIVSPEGPRLRAHLARYFDIMDSCDAMISELAFRDEETPPSAALGPLDAVAFPLRYSHQQQARAASILADGTGRAAGLGLSAAVVFVDSDGELCVLAAQRSTSVATYASCWNVLPAGMAGWRFAKSGLPDAPRGSTFSASYKPSYLENALLREYSEELFGFPEKLFEDESTVAATQCVRRLRDLEATIEFTGIATDLMNLRFEVCALIYIDDPAWFEHERDLIVANWEHRGSGPIRRLPIGESRDCAAEETIVSHMTPGNTVPTGAAALWAGVDRARDLFARRNGVQRRVARPAPGGPLIF